ncbi:MAG: hypothetical protein HY398_00940 [Candidatus Doudnabacteria bacterium]|nr:hypothetical protein [Candidatus Doudnabacteria bacterium]
MNDEVQTGPKDVFLHLLATITLYVSAGSFLALVFQSVNLKFPDRLDNIYSRAAAQGTIRWAIASLLVVFTTYAITTWFLNREYRASEQKRNLRIRRWLVYFTLFVAALIIIGDLVSIIYQFLQGGLTARFLLKVLALFFVAASVFWYYFWELREGWGRTYVRQFSYGIIGIVLLAVVGGFFLVGSPKEERLYRFDEQRVQNLQELQYRVISYWQNKGELPGSLELLRDEISGFEAPRDPETGAEYGYEVKASEHFELCATFARPSRGAPAEAYPIDKYGLPARSDPALSNWEHGAGEVCFDRPFDPDLYKLAPK